MMLLVKKKKQFAVFGGTFDPWTRAHQWIVDVALKSKKFDRVIISPTIVDWHRAKKDKWLSDEQKAKLIVASMEAAGWKSSLLNDVGDMLFTIRDLKVFDPKLSNIDPDTEEWPESEVYSDMASSFPCAILSLRDFKKRDLLSIAPRGPGVLNEKISSYRFIDTLVDLKLTYGVDDEWSVIIGTDSIKSFKSWHSWEDILYNAKLIGVNGREGDALDPEDYGFVSEWISVDDASLADVSASAIREKFASKGNGFEEYMNTFRKE